MVQFSIILPAFAHGPAIEDTLASILRTRPENSQVIVVHAGGFRDEYGLRDEVEQVIVSNDRLVDAWNGAVDRARGEFVVWLAPGTTLDDGWDLDCRSEFLDPDVGAVAPCLVIKTKHHEREIFGIEVEPHGSKRWSMSIHESLGPTMFAGAYRQSALGWIDQIDDAWDDAYLDAYLGLSLNRLGYRPQIARSWVVELEVADTCSAIDIGAHGRSAARATTRFGAPLKPGMCAALFADLGNATLGSKRWSHWCQRLKARTLAKIDAAACIAIAESKTRRQSVTKIGLRRAA